MFLIKTNNFFKLLHYCMMTRHFYMGRSFSADTINLSTVYRSVSIAFCTLSNSYKTDLPSSSENDLHALLSSQHVKVGFGTSNKSRIPALCPSANPQCLFFFFFFAER